MIFSLRKTLLGCSLFFTLLAVGGIDAVAAPLLHCRLQQGDSVIDTQVALTVAPYSVAAIRINQFRFKAVMVGDNSQVEYIKLYTYYESGKRSADDVRLLHEVKYLAPRPQSAPAPSSLTGIIYLYEPRLGREFSYSCALREEETSNPIP